MFLTYLAVEAAPLDYAGEGPRVPAVRQYLPVNTSVNRGCLGYGVLVGLCFYGCECDLSMFGENGGVRSDVAVLNVDPRVLALTGRTHGVLEKNVDVTEFLLGQRTVRTWLMRLSTNTQRGAMSSFRMWWTWLEENHPKFYELKPDGLVDWLDYGETRDRKRVLKAIQNWVLGREGASSTLRSHEHKIRSFFAHNDVELPSARYFNAKATRAKLVSQISVNDFRAIYAGASPVIRAMMLCSVMSGMGRAEVLWFSEHGLESLREQLSRDERVVKVDLPGRKIKKFVDPYYTYLGRDAVQELRRYLRVRDQYARCNHVFVNRNGDPMTAEAFGTRWTRTVRRVGLAREKLPDEGVEYRTGKHFHELRDTFKTRASFSSVKGDWAEFFMGHSIDQLGYNKAMTNEGFMKGQYLSIEPYLNLITMDPMKLDTYELAKMRAEHNDNMINVKSVIKNMAETMRLMGAQLNKVKKNSPEDKVNDMQDRIDRLQAEMVALQDD